MGDVKKMSEKICDNDYYKKLYAQIVKEYRKILKRKEIYKKRSNNRYKKIKCPICNSKNSDFNKYCQKCGVELNYALTDYL